MPSRPTQCGRTPLRSAPRRQPLPQPDPPRVAQGSQAHPCQYAGTGKTQDQTNGFNLDQRCRSKHAERRVHDVNSRRTRADRGRRAEPATSGRTDAQQRDRSDLGGDKRTQHDADDEGFEHTPSMSSLGGLPASTISRFGYR